MEPIYVKPHSYLNVFLPPHQVHRLLEVALPPPVTVGSLVDHLNLPREEIMLVTVNKTRAALDTRVNPGDMVELFPLIGGG